MLAAFSVQFISVFHNWIRKGPEVDEKFHFFQGNKTSLKRYMKIYELLVTRLHVLYTFHNSVLSL